MTISSYRAPGLAASLLKRLSLLLCTVVISYSSFAQLQIENNGNVVIGTDKPENKLTVTNNAGFAGNVAIGTTVSQAHRLAVSGSVRFGIADNSAVGIDADANARLGFIKKFGAGPHISSAANNPIIFSQTNQVDIFSNIATATLTERMRIHSDGNIGINASAPAYRLTIGGKDDLFGVDNAAIFVAKNTAGTYERYFWPRWSDNIMYMNYGSAGFNLRNNSNTSALFITNEGNIGINNTGPTSRLDVQGNIYTTIRRPMGGHAAELRGSTRIGMNSGDFTGMELETEAYSCGNGGIIKFFTWGCNTDYSREVVRINELGRLGIGTKDPQVPLHVNGFVNRNLVNFYFMFRDENRKVANMNPHLNSISIIASNGVEAGAFYAMSDLRIKKDLVITDNYRSLDLIKRIQVTGYHYKDEILNGTEEKTGFIAQQVEQVFPQAVQMRSGFVPDIFTQADSTAVDRTSLIITLKKPHGLLTGDIVRLITASGETREETVTVTGVKTFTVAGTSAPAGKIFVYGRQVSDVRSVDYQQIFTLGIGAIQELSKEADELNAENQLLKTTVQALTLQMQAMQEQLNRLETKINHP